MVDRGNVLRLKTLSADITDVTTGVVVHGVNCQGVMGSGVALAIRQKWPDVFEDYTIAVDVLKQMNNHRLLLGHCQSVKITEQLHVCNCFTQFYYGKDGQRYADLSAIEQSVSAAMHLAKHLDLPFYIVKIGCGLGGLSWSREVEPLLEHLANKIDISVFVCEKGTNK